MKKNISATEVQISEFITFIDKIVKQGTAELTTEDKLKLREAFYTLVRTAKSEVLAEVALRLRDLHDEINK